MTHPILDLPHEIIDHIANFLCIREKYGLKHLSKFMFNAISIRITDFDEKLCKILDDVLGDVTVGKKFLDQIKESDGTIKLGGSSILQCIHDEKYEGSDIDVYIDCRDVVDHINESQRDDDNDDYIMLQSKINLARNNDRCLPKDILGRFKSMRTYESLLIFLGRKNFHYSENDINDYIIPGASITNLYRTDVTEKKHKIQIILLTQKYDDIPHDFIFCKNIYDGRNVYSKNIGSVINKKGEMNSLNILCKSTNSSRYVGGGMIRLQEIILERIIKYYDRGYTITNLYKIYDEMHHTIKNKYNNIFCVKRKKRNILDLPNKLIKYIGKFLCFPDKVELKCSCKHTNYVVCICKKYFEKLLCKTLGSILNTSVGGQIMYEHIDDNFVKLDKRIKNYCLNPGFDKPSCIEIDIKYSDLDMKNMGEYKHLAYLLTNKTVIGILQTIYSYTDLTISWQNSGKNMEIPTYVIHIVNRENITVVKLNMCN